MREFQTLNFLVQTCANMYYLKQLIREGLERCADGGGGDGGDDGWYGN
jgi:hypothetical protein